MNRREEIQDTISFDLFLEIFSRLPSKSITRFHCVSKQWGSMLHSQYFTELFLTRSWARPHLLIILERNRECSVFSSPQLQHPYGKSSLVVSADFHIKFSGDMWSTYFRRVLTSGLIYFSNIRFPEKKGADAVGPVIFNPTTRQYATLPKLETDGMLRSFLGFDPIDKQFKVLVMASGPLCSIDHRILTLETRKLGWRKIQCPLTYFPYPQGIFINGVLYYLADCTSDVIGEVPSLMIVCFDVRSQNFKFIEVEECFCAILINYKGKLGGIRHNTLELRMWVLKDVEKQEWSKYVYTLQDDRFVDLRYVNVVGVTNTGEIVLSMYNLNRFMFSTSVPVEIQGFGDYYDMNRHGAFIFVDYIEDIYVNDLKYLKSSQDLLLKNKQQNKHEFLANLE
ncbi:hypothetical protein EUTSA_v10009932mg [Eutrema salsugineum]|uniref:F-box domain-containing protein n=1 Tax=Eutrema salsugineum TaxID=72664 RepID=V4KR23_EUTSA|nr:hypothetical protein EUTSA_v10009932mg [Eutrema salsugineum]